MGGYIRKSEEIDMTPAVHEFVKGLGLAGMTLDVGSMNINGCVRALFPLYCGLDMRSGANVDVVGVSNAMPFDDKAFDNVLCLEMLEHDADPFGSVKEMRRVLKPGGTLVITTPGIGFPRHDYPCDYWRFTGDGVRVLMDGMNEINIKEDSDHVYAIAKNK